METLKEILEWAVIERNDAHHMSQRKEAAGQIHAASIYYAEFEVYAEVVKKLSPLVKNSLTNEPEIIGTSVQLS